MVSSLKNENSRIDAKGLWVGNVFHPHGARTFLQKQDNTAKTCADTWEHECFAAQSELQ
jgi:hypothetical protein